MLVHTLTHTHSPQYVSLVFLLHVNEMFIFVFNFTSTLASHPSPHLLMHTPRCRTLVAIASLFLYRVKVVESITVTSFI